MEFLPGLFFSTETKILSRMARIGEFIEYFLKFLKILALFVHSRYSRLKVYDSKS